jgi:hypothetical protein
MPAGVFAQEIAEGGSPLYSLTVRESLKGLKDRGKDQAAGSEAVCPKCGKVHPPRDAAGTNRVVAPPAPAGKPCPVCGKVHPQARNGTEPSEDKGAMYVYCEKCKVYHRRRQDTPAHPPE